MLIALATIWDLEVRQINIKTAFLNGTLDEDVYMLPPPGIPWDGRTGQVFKLVKSLYGLKQSPRAWNANFDEYIRSQGFNPLQTDSLVYTNTTCKSMVILLIYVDDIVVVGKQLSSVLKTLDNIKAK
jgi:hypothetical protein